MSAVAEKLRRKADDYRALAGEHTSPEDPQRTVYEVVELSLREVADALEDEDDA